MEAFVNTVIMLTGLVVVQIILGKRGAFPYGIMLGLNLYVVSIVIIITDLILITVMVLIIDATNVSVHLPRTIKKRVNKLYEWLKGSNWGRRMQNLGKLGTMIITATPFVGGIWSGVTMSQILFLSRNVTFLLVSIGSIIGCGIFLIASELIIQMFL